MIASVQSTIKTDATAEAFPRRLVVPLRVSFARVNKVREANARRYQTAFTLIELVVVMLILAILAGTVVYSLSGTLDRYWLGQTAERMELFDAHARRQAVQRRTSVVASIDGDRHLLEVVEPANRLSERFEISSRVEVAEIRARQSVRSADGLQLVINRHGQSPSYAVKLQRHNQYRWLIVLGRSGQTISIADEEMIDAILAR